MKLKIGKLYRKPRGKKTALKTDKSFIRLAKIKREKTQNQCH
jgi:hypothetical protein